MHTTEGVVDDDPVIVEVCRIRASLVEGEPGTKYKIEMEREEEETREGRDRQGVEEGKGGKRRVPSTRISPTSGVGSVVLDVLGNSVARKLPDVDTY